MAASDSLLNEDQRMIRDMARAFAQERLAPNSAAWEKAGAYPREIIDEMGALGLMGMSVPEEWGGAGTDQVSYALALMEIASGDGGLSTVMSVHNSPNCKCVLSYGTNEQKEQFLRPMASGEMVSAFCLTEPGAGSDASAIKTKAVKDGNGYRLSGTKQFITSGKSGQVAIVFAVTDPEAGKKGISGFIVPTDTPGYVVAKVEEKLGQKASDTCQIVFDDMRVAGEALLGNEGQGYKIALENLASGRIGIASQSVGMASAALEFAIAYAKERQAFGKSIFDHQAVGFRLAEMATKLEAARLLTLNAARLSDKGVGCLKEAAMAKLYASEVAEEICSAAIQTLGGYGYLSEYPIERIYRDVRVCQIYEGTSDIQKLIITRQL
jgi:alkylation response protein AidB-like acyl-CoA dehydrogenase